MHRPLLERVIRHISERDTIRNPQEQMHAGPVFYLLAMSLLFAGCSGAGGTSSHIISGMAIVGLPLAGQAKIKDASNPSQEKAVLICSDGSFAFDVSNMKGPYILEARGSAGGINYTMYSFAEKEGIANITPLSNLVVTIAARADDPGQIYTHPDPVMLQKMELNLPIAIATLQSKLKPLFDLYGIDSADPIKEYFSFNGSGFGALFDDMKFIHDNGDLTIVDSITGIDIFTSKAAYVNVGRFVNLPTRHSFPQHQQG